LPASFSESIDAGARAARLGVCALAFAFANIGVALADEPADIRLDLSPRVCTLAPDDQSCDTEVTARWRSPRDESLCLLIVGQPQIRRCWENHKEGVYTVRLVFREDLLVELRDTQLEKVLAAETIAVIKEALRLRRKRRQPWDILS
jgi:hypothetical protein